MAERILIADDEPYILHVLAVKLRNAGFDVLTAGDGEQALQLAVDEHAEMIITDFQMPRMDGLELAEQFRRQCDRPVPIVIITAREFDLDARRVEECGVEKVLAKPFSPRQVVHIVRDLLSHPQQSAAE